MQNFHNFRCIHPVRAVEASLRIFPAKSGFVSSSRIGKSNKLQLTFQDGVSDYAEEASLFFFLQVKKRHSFSPYKIEISAQSAHSHILPTWRHGVNYADGSSYKENYISDIATMHVNPLLNCSEACSVRPIAHRCVRDVGRQVRRPL
ncbi:hypothetical protein LMG28727_07379 [Paraburkholderia kirstenboschensis]|uniref:hypothetical protein n=1 Tax=Paraburkholderia kirstenboschensis TaxID=1245436 RepID=UPI00191B5FB2|nr:hypothetical protein [Paraburkholderia kirstenboschensis]CAD6561268.1 hypothetical protein LMG28727_07379 [Paraburkholderia kirstenboschensis]